MQLFSDYHNVTNTYSIDGMMLFDGEQHLERLRLKMIKIPTSPKELSKEFRNRYHIKGTEKYRNSNPEGKIFL